MSNNIYNLLSNIAGIIGIITVVGLLFYFMSGGFDRPQTIYDVYNHCRSSCVDGWGRLEDIECLKVCENLLVNKTKNTESYKVCFNCTCITPQEDIYWEGEEQWGR